MIPSSKMHPRYWAPVWWGPQLAVDAEDLALKIVGDDAFSNILALVGDVAAPALVLARARDVAEAQIEQRRIHQVQHELSRDLPPSQSFQDLVAAAKLIRKNSPARSLVLAIYQYERRVLSRCKKANRALDAARRRRRHARRVLRLTKRLHRRVTKHAKNPILPYDFFKKKQANRANAQHSTGPKSPAGKARSARDARQHGLATPARSDPTLAAAIESLARAIAGEEPDADKLTMVRDIAEAQIGLIRIQQVRLEVLAAGQPCEARCASEQISATNSDLRSTIAAINRYERRALSRRKTAIRAFDAARFSDLQSE